jgi:hypothetical protein
VVDVLSAGQATISAGAPEQASSSPGNCPECQGTLFGAAALTLEKDIKRCRRDRLLLEEISSKVWDSWGHGEINETEADGLSKVIHRLTSRGGESPPSIGQLASRFPPRRPSRSPDRKASRERRRELGGSSALPPEFRRHYTESQRAVLFIVAGEVKRSGVCELPIDKVAALAGVCRSSVQATLNKAAELFHLKIRHRPRRGEKSDTNWIEIASSEWREWIRRGPSAAHRIGSKISKILDPAKNIDSAELEGLTKKNTKKNKVDAVSPGTKLLDSILEVASDFERQCRELAGDLPVAFARDFHEISAVVGGEITCEDVFKGIRQARTKASFKIKYWKKMIGWARHAAERRIVRALKHHVTG